MYKFMGSLPRWFKRVIKATIEVEFVVSAELPEEVGEDVASYEAELERMLGAKLNAMAAFGTIRLGSVGIKRADVKVEEVNKLP